MSRPLEIDERPTTPAFFLFRDRCARSMPISDYGRKSHSRMHLPASSRSRYGMSMIILMTRASYRRTKLRGKPPLSRLGSNSECSVRSLSLRAWVRSGVVSVSSDGTRAIYRWSSPKLTTRHGQCASREPIVNSLDKVYVPIPLSYRLLKEVLLSVCSKQIIVQHQSIFFSVSDAIVTFAFFMVTPHQTTKT